MEWGYYHYFSSSNGKLESDSHVHAEDSSDGVFAHRPAALLSCQGVVAGTPWASYLLLDFMPPFSKANLRIYLQFPKETFLLNRVLFLILFLLKDSWFAVLCQFLLYSIVTQSYVCVCVCIYIYSLYIYIFLNIYILNIYTLYIYIIYIYIYI